MTSYFETVKVRGIRVAQPMRQLRVRVNRLIPLQVLRRCAHYRVGYRYRPIPRGIWRSCSNVWWVSIVKCASLSPHQLLYLLAHTSPTINPIRSDFWPTLPNHYDRSPGCRRFFIRTRKPAGGHRRALYTCSLRTHSHANIITHTFTRVFVGYMTLIRPMAEH